MVEGQELIPVSSWLKFMTEGISVLELALVPDYSQLREGVLFLNCLLTIDKVLPYVPGENDVDLFELFQSIQQSGSHFIFTCRCGVAECAGYHSGIAVVTKPQITVWADGDSGRRYIFSTQQVRSRIHFIHEDLLDWKERALALHLQLRIWPDTRPVEAILRVLKCTRQF